MSHDAHAHAHEQQQIEATIAGLQAQRGALGDALVDAALQPLRQRLQGLSKPGEPTTGAAPEAQVLRQVSILFLDVVGFTALSRRLDPEDIHELIDGALARSTTVVQAHGGRVMQYAGDNLLAVFGADAAREDDPERAVRCGLALLAQGRTLGERARVLAGADASADVRVGIHTGPALLGGGVDGDGSVRGVAVNVAARMEQSAPPGGLRISRDTWRQVRGLFDAEAQPPLLLKGLGAPQASWLVHGERGASEAAAQRGVEGISTPLVGRAAEAAALHGALAQARSSGQLQRVTLLAEPGLGKSRLLATVANGFAGQARVHRARAARHGLHQPYGVLRHWLSLQGGLSDGDDADTARAKIAAVLGAGWGGDAQSAETADGATALVGQLIGLDFAQHPQVRPLANDARQLRQRAFNALAQWLRALAQQSPQALLFDDMHWADEGSLDAVEHLAMACAGAPVLLAMFARPELRERRPGWCSTALTLAPLGAAAATQLLDALLLRAPDTPPTLRQMLLTHADGNPFHLEELVAMCLDDGVFVAAAEGRWHVDTARLQALRVPPTLAGVLQTRFDGLGAAERRALQQASVVGHVHWDRALHNLEPGAERQLAALALRDLVRPHDDSAFADAQEFAFKHHLLHQAAYDTVLKRDRRAWHRGTAEWLVQASGSRIGEHLALVAEHFERAGEPAQAMAWWLRADDGAIGAAAYAAAEHHVQRALQLLPALPTVQTEEDRRQHFDVQWRLARVYNATGRRDEQEVPITHMESLAEQLGDDRLRARAASQRGQVLLMNGHYRQSIAVCERALGWATAVGDPALAVFPLANKGLAHHFLNEAGPARSALAAALPLARAGVSAEAEIVVLNRLSMVEREAGDSALRLAHMHEALAVAQRAGLLRMQAALQTNLAAWDLDIGQFDSAGERATQALHIVRTIGDRGNEPYALAVLAIVADERGDSGLALDLAQQALVHARASGDAHHVATLQRELGAYHARLGQAGPAREAFAASDDGLRNRAGHVAGAHPELINLALDGGDLALARELADAQLAQCPVEEEPRIDSNGVMALLWACRRVALAEGDTARAAALLARAHAHLQRCRDLLPEAHREAWTQTRRAHRVITEAWAARPPSAQQV